MKKLSEQLSEKRAIRYNFVPCLFSWVVYFFQTLFRASIKRFQDHGVAVGGSERDAEDGKSLGTIDFRVPWGESILEGHSRLVSARAFARSPSSSGLLLVTSFYRHSAPKHLAQARFKGFFISMEETICVRQFVLPEMRKRSLRSGINDAGDAGFYVFTIFCS